MRNANGIVVRWIMVSVVGFVFVGCKSGPRWDWWRISKGNPADSSPVARSAGVELPSVTAARAEQGASSSTLASTNADAGGLAPRFQPGTQIPNSNTLATATPGYPATGYPTPGLPEGAQPVGTAMSSGSPAVAPGVALQAGPYDPNSYANTQFAQTTPTAEPVPGATGSGGNMPLVTPHPQTPVYLPAVTTAPQYGPVSGAVADGTEFTSPTSVDPVGTPAAGPMMAATPATGLAPFTADNTGNSLRDSRSTTTVAVAPQTPGTYRPGGTSDYLGTSQAPYSLAARPDSSKAPPPSLGETGNQDPPITNSPSSF